jgi:hypothetical protein
MNKIEKQIREDVPDLEEFEFDKENLDKLVGYAEMYGNDFIPLYKGVNYIPFDSHKKALTAMKKKNRKAMFTTGDEETIIGHLVLNNGSTIYLQDKELYLQKPSKSYEESGEELSEDESYDGMALEWYHYNTIGGYMDGIPAFAILYSK